MSIFIFFYGRINIWIYFKIIYIIFLKGIIENNGGFSIK